MYVLNPGIYPVLFCAWNLLLGLTGEVAPLKALFESAIGRRDASLVPSRGAAREPSPLALYKDEVASSGAAFFVVIGKRDT